MTGPPLGTSPAIDCEDAHVDKMAKSVCHGADRPGASGLFISINRASDAVARMHSLMGRQGEELRRPLTRSIPALGGGSRSPI
jgi:hypothetical protein